MAGLQLCRMTVWIQQGQSYDYVDTGCGEQNRDGKKGTNKDRYLNPPHYPPLSIQHPASFHPIHAGVVYWSSLVSSVVVVGSSEVTSHQTGETHTCQCGTQLAGTYCGLWGRGYCYRYSCSIFQPTWQIFACQAFSPFSCPFPRLPSARTKGT